MTSLHNLCSKAQLKTIQERKMTLSSSFTSKLTLADVLIHSRRCVGPTTLASSNCSELNQHLRALPTVQLLEKIFPRWFCKMLFSCDFNKLTKIVMFSVAEWNHILLSYRKTWDRVSWVWVIHSLWTFLFNGCTGLVHNASQVSVRNKYMLFIHKIQMKYVIVIAFLMFNKKNQFYIY